MSLKSLQSYLSGRKKNPPMKKFSECNHGKDYWCNNCVNFGQDVEVTLPNGDISKGTIFTN